MIRLNQFEDRNVTTPDNCITDIVPLASTGLTEQELGHPGGS